VKDKSNLLKVNDDEDLLRISEELLEENEIPQVVLDKLVFDSLQHSSVTISKMHFAASSVRRGGTSGLFV
jgi:hypothetical protein